MTRFPIPLLFATIVACGTSDPRTEPQVVQDAFAREEAAVIRAVLDQLYPDSDVRVLQAGTGVFRGDASGLRAYIGAVVEGPELAANYVTRNSRPLDLRSMLGALSSSRPVRVVSRAELDMLPGRHPDAYWRSFYAKYPGSGGLITVTRPGFSADASAAVMYVGRVCGTQCGALGFALLRKESGRWIVKDHRIDPRH